MKHTRDEVIDRTVREFELLDRAIAGLTEADWSRPIGRPEGKDAWTVKDVVAHVTHWKADVLRSLRRQRRPAEERGLTITQGNRLVYLRWHDVPPAEVLAWHRRVQAEMLAALRGAPEAWFAGKERREDWPFDAVGHIAEHRVHDVERALEGRVDS
jgi:hypothetical protein